ncbi:Hypothetical_protein [Hexamita inflata]|uniref:Hypothetical_protein n=1 Tax=Hexamita inflata TaxID=28002 RepID=A0AA86R3Y9_9EUKA|nr:Hypothetical protein HINF_LOCUS58879 [Hexamita inflata]CAI9971235.1 Hypothetical protein HINF_LOCUS58880 [Hexamita inflata]CAI9971237.1 Hypothetical protein HINF_LOCUS58882 [Hexamita inflata]
MQNLYVISVFDRLRVVCNYNVHFGTQKEIQKRCENTIIQTNETTALCYFILKQLHFSVIICTASSIKRCKFSQCVYTTITCELFCYYCRIYVFLIQRRVETLNLEISTQMAWPCLFTKIIVADGE